MSHTPSKYQAAVYHFIEEGKGNAVVDAVAGSGKSTTLAAMIGHRNSNQAGHTRAVTNVFRQREGNRLISAQYQKPDEHFRTNLRGCICLMFHPCSFLMRFHLHKAEFWWTW